MISIIIPTFNRPKWLIEAIESVYDQDFDDFELIIVDDGSTDSTKEILIPYMPRINYIYQPNGGVAKARNNGIKESKGEYIAFLDHDDRWMPFKLKLLWELTQRHPDLALICSDFSAFRDNKIIATSYIKTYFSIFTRKGIDFPDIFENSEEISNLFPKEISSGKKNFYWGSPFKTIFQGGFIIPSTMIVKKSALIEEKGFDENLPGVDDYKLSLFLSIKHKIGYIDYPTIWYRLSPEQLSDRADKLALQWEMNLSIIEEAIQKSRGIIELDQEFIHQRKDYILNNLATFSMKNGNRKRAREYWKEILSHSPWNQKAYFGLLLTLAPDKLILLLKKLKNFLRGIHIIIC